MEPATTVYFTHQHDVYNAGETATFPASIARDLVAKGVAVIPGSGAPSLTLLQSELSPRPQELHNIGSDLPLGHQTQPANPTVPTNPTVPAGTLQPGQQQAKPVTDVGPVPGGHPDPNYVSPLHTSVADSEVTGVFDRTAEHPTTLDRSDVKDVGAHPESGYHAPEHTDIEGGEVKGLTDETKSSDAHTTKKK